MGTEEARQSTRCQLERRGPHGSVDGERHVACGQLHRGGVRQGGWPGNNCRACEGELGMRNSGATAMLFMGIHNFVIMPL